MRRRFLRERGALDSTNSFGGHELGRDLQQHSRYNYPIARVPAWVCWLVAVVWCQPQTLIGALWFLVVRGVWRDATTERYRSGTLLTRSGRTSFGVSLGPFIFAYRYSAAQEAVRPGAQRRFADHEWGHFVQSIYLGPLYLPLVGLPSIIRLIAGRRRWRRDPAAYFRAYPEAWADTLGRVIRPATLKAR